MEIMGILNITPDSFSDGGRFESSDAAERTERAVAAARALVADGATIIDVGGESTRPGAQRVSAEDEQARVVPVIAALAASGIRVSVDTMRASTAAAAVRAGAEFVNDVSGGLADERMLATVAEIGTPYILGHWRGQSDRMNELAHYDDAAADVVAELSERVRAARAAGIRPEQIILDPGLGFSKRAEHNWAILRATDALGALGHPILLGASRKRFLTTLAGEEHRDLATAVISAVAAERNLWGVRVHDVRATAVAIDTARLVRQPAVAGAPSGALDEIRLAGLTVRAHHGVFDFERRDGQNFVIDVCARLSFAASSASDDVAETVHYGELAEEITAAVARDPLNLIEGVAERVARVVLAHSRVEEVEVEVHKPDAPITVPFGDVSVRITRNRASLASTKAVIALGSNLGDRGELLRAGLDAIAALDGVEIERVARVVETPALTLQGIDRSAPAYLNTVAIVSTEIDAETLLRRLLDIEATLGRERTERWGPRTIDLDVIDFGGRVRESERLTLPHPRAHERTFVMLPWVEIDPDAVLPGRGRVADVAARLDASDVTITGIDLGYGTLGAGKPETERGGSER